MYIYIYIAPLQHPVVGPALPISSCLLCADKKHKQTSKKSRGHSKQNKHKQEKAAGEEKGEHNNKDSKLPSCQISECVMYC